MELQSLKPATYPIKQAIAAVEQLGKASLSLAASPLRFAGRLSMHQTIDAESLINDQPEVAPELPRIAVFAEAAARRKKEAQAQDRTLVHAQHIRTQGTNRRLSSGRVTSERHVRAALGSRSNKRMPKR